MKEFNFNRWNKILGWVVFAIALFVYGSTVEPTASFWDPGEFISVSTKLQVGHPPGAPLFQMIGAFVSIFASDSAHIALMINLVSALSSAFVILFMFWSLSLLIRKVSGPADTLNTGAKMAVLGSALIGSLAFTFTDSFWFNAVEAEVYAMAMFFMAAMFYVGLLWERDMFKPRGNRWLILLAFLVGLTFGVHFLALLVIPAIGYLYYFKHTEKITVKNFILASIVVVGILLFIFMFLLPYALSFFGYLEIFFINSIGLPFGSGSIIAALILIAAIYFGLRYTRKKGYIHFNTIILSVLFIFIGFSCWLMLPIRANAGTIINENDPNNARALLAYYNREQYPHHPLFNGTLFTYIYAGLDEENPYVDGKPKYVQNHETGRYEIVNNPKNAKQNAPDDQKAFLSRLWSTKTSHIINYMDMTEAVEFHLKPEDSGNEQLRRLVQQVKKGYAQGKIDNSGLAQFFDQYGSHLIIKKPTLGANLEFMFNYQFMYMYFRYFMWNFVGRQDDTQGRYTNEHGNWMSGITPIDSFFFGSQKHLPDLVKNDAARNTYYFLPLILGLIGLFFQFDKDKRNFWVIMVLFLFTGLILTFYLNERPFEPRERDYARVGSFYAFSIWIGFGVYALYDKLKKYLKPNILAPALTLICLLAVPALMAQQNWDDHDRSGKRTATALAKNYLNSVGTNGILFTVGDNDTFPLWYAQEVEGVRTDVKVINTSLFATAWYIDQMKRETYKSPPLETTLTHDNYTYGTNDVVLYRRDPRVPDTMLLANWLKYIKSDNPSTKVKLSNGHQINTFPTKNIKIKVNIENAIQSGIVKEDDRDKVLPYIHLHIGTNQITKNILLMLDVVANLDWTRPVYFSGGSNDAAQYLWMRDYLEVSGLTYELVPIKTEAHGYGTLGRIDPQELYKQVMDWHWGNSGDPDMYYDPETRRQSISYRSKMARLVQELIAINAYDKAKNVLDLAMEKLPIDKMGYYTLVYPFIADYYKIGETQRAREIWNHLAGIYQQQIDYYSYLPPGDRKMMSNRVQETIAHYRRLLRIVKTNDTEEYIKKKTEEFKAYLNKINVTIQ